MRKLFKISTLLTSFIMCFSLFGCDSGKNDTNKIEAETITENQNMLNLIIDYDENVSFKVSDSWLREGDYYKFYVPELDNYVGLTDTSGGLATNVSEDVSLAINADSLLNEGTLKNYKIIKIGNQKAISGVGSGFIGEGYVLNYFFINDKTYILMYPDNMNPELSKEFINNVQINGKSNDKTDNNDSAQIIDKEKLSTLDLMVEYDENVSYMVSSAWVKDEDFYAIGASGYIVMNDNPCDTSTFESDEEFLNMFADRMISEGTWYDYEITKIGNKKAILVTQDGMISYTFLVNNKMYILSMPDTLEKEIIDKIISRIQIKQ